MTPFGEFIKRVGERIVGKYYEGPTAPERLRAMVLKFAEDNPRATRWEWVEFAAEFANESYRSGYVRGFEYVERDLEGIRPDLPPEVVADMMDPDWRWSDPVDLSEPHEVVPEERDESFEVARNIKMANEASAVMNDVRRRWARSR